MITPTGAWPIAIAQLMMAEDEADHLIKRSLHTGAPTSVLSEASMLRFPVGRWPMKVLLVIPEGDDVLFVHDHQEGESHVYTSVRPPMTLTVLND